MAANNFAARSAQVHLGAKNAVADFVKEPDVDDKLKCLYKKVSSNKIKRVLVENELDQLSGKIQLMSTKGLKKDLIHGYILKDAKYFSSGVLQNFLVFISANTLIFLDPTNLFMEI